MNAQKYYTETVRRARVAESIADEVACWNEFLEMTKGQPEAETLRGAALARIEALKAMEESA